VRAAFLHILGDLLASLGVIVGGTVMYLTEWYVVDPLVSIIIGGIILKGAYGVVRETAAVLLEAVPSHIDLDSLVAEIESITGVKDFHDVHIWTLSSGIYALSAHVQIHDQMVSESAQIMDRVRRYLADRYNISHITLQPESELCGPDSICALTAPPEIYGLDNKSDV
jgi:cobalt-zinc-cadmium efflux system protein